MYFVDLQSEYDAIRSQAVCLAGDLLDIPRRVNVLYNLYLDSGRNHTFSQIAAHGALWAYNYFETGGTLGKLIARRYFYNPKEQAFRLSILKEFSDGFRDVNRSVCIDTFTNYHFSKLHGRHPDASEFVTPSLLDALNRVHHAKRKRLTLSEKEKRDIFSQSFHCEQEVTVAPGVARVIAGFDCRIMRFLCLRPFVRFAFFPQWRYMIFRDFASKEERIEKGLRAYYYAEQRGWPGVSDSMRDYRVMPNEFFSYPEKIFAEIEKYCRVPDLVAL